MTEFLTRFTGVIAGALLMATAAHAAGVLEGKDGMTLYTFDKDTGGTPSCYDACADNWPPYMATKGEDMMKGWTMVERKDGSMQWAYDGKPLYYFKGDAKKGDMAGDGVGGAWHTVPQ